MPTKDDLQKQIATHHRRLQKRKEQQAQMGINTPPEILTEIEDIETTLADLQAQLEAPGGSVAQPEMSKKERQYQIEKESIDLSKPSAPKISHDLYEKRYAIYSKVREMIRLICKDANVEMKTMLAFRDSTHEAYFLFGNDTTISSYINEIYQNGLKLYAINNVLKGLPVGDERSRLVNQSTELIYWFNESRSCC